MALVTVTLLVPEALDEEVVGLLYEHAPTARAGFTAREVRWHGDAATYRTLLEQIRGYTRMVEICVTLAEADMIDLVQTLRDSFAGRGLTVRVNPAIETSADPI